MLKVQPSGLKSLPFNLLFRLLSSVSHKNIQNKEQSKDQAGNTIGGKKGQIYTTEVIGLDQGVLIKQQADKQAAGNPV